MLIHVYEEQILKYQCLLVCWEIISVILCADVNEPENYKIDSFLLT